MNNEEMLLLEIRKLKERVERLELLEAGEWITSAVPFTHTSWGGAAKTAADTGTVDLSAFSNGTDTIPPNIRAVAIRASAKDETPNVLIQLSADSGAEGAVVIRTQIANIYKDASGLVPCDSNGDVYVSFADEVDNMWLQIWAYLL